MKKFLLTLTSLLTMYLSGCVVVPNQSDSSNVAQDITPEISRVIAKDAANQLGRMYAMGKTTLDLGNPSQDPFRAELIAYLRQQGFAVKETEKQTWQLVNPNEKREDSNDSEALNDSTISIIYDVNSGEDYYFISLKAGGQNLTRTYTLADTGVVPAGHWVRKK